MMEKKSKHSIKISLKVRNLEINMIWPLALSALFFLIFTPAYANDIRTSMSNNLNFILKTSPYNTIFPNGRDDHQNQISPIGFVAGGMITFYQKFISSQNMSVCNFRPSCSHFTHTAINRLGFFHGILIGADRILRCHPYSLNLYDVDIKVMKALDPVENYVD